MHVALCCVLAATESETTADLTVVVVVVEVIMIDLCHAAVEVAMEVRATEVTACSAVTD